MDKELSKLYYNIKKPSGFSSIDSLWKATGGKYTRSQVVNWLQKQETYTLHRPMRKKFKRNKYFVTNIDDVWQCDLNDLRSIKDHNNGFSYLLTIIDMFSKYAWAVPLRSKTGAEVTDAFRHVFESSGRKPLKLNCDNGREFKNRIFQDYLRTQNIAFYTTSDTTKAAMVERLNRTLKTKMWRVLTYHNSKRYIDMLPDLLTSYNDSVHSATKFAPSKVDENVVLQVWHNLYPEYKQKPSLNFKLNIGDNVRISKDKGVFDKGYYANYSREVFVVHKAIRRNPVVYVLKDYNGSIIKGTFYEQELQKVYISPDSTYQIDKILHTRGKGNSRKLFVRWRGYGPEFDSYIAASDLIQI